tara:strand:- start:258 stop:956 length:699 start_codon:yes stop_codon:yes gene_type:complete
MTNFSKKKRIVALLPMKANSVRIKGKNFINFCGKPLFKWILDTLLSIKEIDQIVINTDARKELLENNVFDTDKVLIRDRKKSICGDLISMNLVLADDIENIAADFYVMVHATSPLISAKTIKSCINTFTNDKNSDSLFTVNKFQTRFYRKDASPINHDPDNLIRTQDLEPWFEENSNLYIFSSESFHKTKARIGIKPIMFETPKSESIDIDNNDDLELAVIAMKQQKMLGNI